MKKIDKNSSKEPNEVFLQKPLQKYLSDPSKTFNLTDGRVVQVLSPGRLNPHEGPDYLEMALLIDGKVHIGDAEFHKKTSLWLSHNHAQNPHYKSVILHIVFENDIELKENFATLIVDKTELEKIANDNNKDTEEDLETFSIEELQNFALMRLLRFTSDAQRVVNDYSVNESLVILAKIFFERYLSRRRRPNYDNTDLEKLVDKLPDSNLVVFLNKIANSHRFSITDELVLLMKTKIHQEGSAIRRELILNVVVPLALTIADEESRISLFVWYWSTPSFNKYGVLARKFPEFPQNFIWQQQGMLEYTKEIEHKTSTITEMIDRFKIEGTLNFLKLGEI
jgi:hypothetical protein